jgi:tryptophan-rich sensory protein
MEEIGESTVWDFMAWLFMGLFATMFSWWTIGDLTQIYWLPMLNREEWMITPRWMMKYWAGVYVIGSVAAWHVWRDEGGWPGATGPLTVYVLVVAFAMLWHLMLFWMHRIQASFYIGGVVGALAVWATVWFFLADVVPGILMLIMTLWIFYVVYWNFMLARCNMTGGKVRKCGTDPNITFQADIGAGLPPPKVWHATGRHCPYAGKHKRARHDEVAQGTGTWSNRK